MESIEDIRGASKKAPKVDGLNEIPHVYYMGGQKFIVFLKGDEIAFLERKHKEVK
ncbi:MAG: hypothetical protein QXU18_11785 [Thermoplasmatales archaeon]